MTTITETDVDALRARFAAVLARRLNVHVERLRWDAERLAEHQRERLRELLACALERSPFHAARLRGVDPERFELEDLARLPVMSKQEMMAGFDCLPTDDRVTRARVERHLAASTDQPSLLYDQYVCLASGGSSGLRGIFVQTLGEYADFAACVLRRTMARVLAAGGSLEEGITVGIVAAASPVHSSGYAAAISRGQAIQLLAAPATLPLAELVQRLNEMQPPAVVGNTTKLALLAAQQRAGRLRIAPRSISAMGELLCEEDRAAIGEAFGVPPVTQFTSTEGLVGHSEPGEAVLTFATDMCIVELVDADDRPVPPRTPSAKVLVTNLHNRTQPLIRYELTDQFVGQRAPFGDGYLRATVRGRADDVFHYGPVAVDPLVIRTVMVATPAALEYQVIQTERGIDVAVVAEGELAPGTLAESLQRALRAAGVPDPQVSVHTVADIARHPETGKARRLISSATTI